MILIDIIILTNIKGLGTVNTLKILNYFNSHKLKTLSDLVDADLSKVVSPRLATTIKEYIGGDIENLYHNTKQLLKNYEQSGISCVSIEDELYPNILKESTNPPIILYCKGNVDLLSTKCIAVIGTRENTTIGKQITQKSVKFLVENNFTIVSGLAKGIDTISHKSAIEYNGKTIAILPIIDKIYPSENKQLAQNILNHNGLLISEVKPNTNFNSGQLVKRDRIQSGLSKAVFVIESTINGGSMYATNDALKLKRLVFTPDIYKLGEDYQRLIQVTGIKKLIDTNQSIAYTSDNYGDIVKRLHKPSSDSLWQD